MGFSILFQYVKSVRIVINFIKSCLPLFMMLTGWLVSWLVGWLIGWLVDWLV